jgi:hypothetical protein
MTFSTKVQDINDSRATLAHPAAIYRDLARGFERIKSPPGVRLSFVHKGKSIELNYPDTDQYEPVDDPGTQPGFDVSQLSKLMESFRERAAQYASDSKIIMFRERTPQSYQEELVARSGKMLALPFSGAETQIQPAEVRERVLSQDELVALEDERSRDMFEVLEHIGDIINKNRAKGISHELYCPVLYHQYVVGYMYFVKAGSDQDPFPGEAFSFALYYARILAYALKKNGYFKADVRDTEFGAPEVIDISGSGALFVLPEDTPDIHLFTDLDIKLHLPESSIPIKGRIVRKFDDGNSVFLAVQFIQLDPDDMDSLIEHIYGRNYQGDVDSQGAADPRNLPPGEL